MTYFLGAGIECKRGNQNRSNFANNWHVNQFVRILHLCWWETYSGTKKKAQPNRSPTPQTKWKMICKRIWRLWVSVYCCWVILKIYVLVPIGWKKIQQNFLWKYIIHFHMCTHIKFLDPNGFGWGES